MVPLGIPVMCSPLFYSTTLLLILRAVTIVRNIIINAQNPLETFPRKDREVANLLPTYYRLVDLRCATT